MKITRITCGYILAKLLKQLSFFTQTDVESLHKLFFAKPSTIIVENTENSPYSSSYTIERQLVRNSHLLSQKLAFSQVPHQLFFKQGNLLTRKLSKQQLTVFTSIVKRYMAKCYKHAPISSKCTIVVTGVSKYTNTHAQNTKQINFANIRITNKTYHNGLFFSY